MSDEHQLHTAANKAAQAKTLLEHKLLAEAFDGLERDYSAALFQTSPEASGARETLYLAVNVVRKVRDHLRVMVNDGKLAQAELKELHEAAERKKKWTEV